MKRPNNIPTWSMVGCWVALLFGAFSSGAQVPAWVQATNAVEFFTNMSSRLLSAGGYPFDANNIPVYTNNTFVFSPDVHRILQVAANIYDATTNHHPALGDADLPTVFRPTFRQQVDGPYTNIYIGGFAEVGVVSGVTDPRFVTPLDLNDDADRALVGTAPVQNIYDVPWIIGVKKGFPNFNEFAMQSVSQITRKLQLRRPTIASRPNVTNQLFVVGISNVFAFEAWNSYPSNYARAVQVIAANDMTISFGYTNDAVLDLRGSNISVHVTAVALTNLDTNAWSGYGVRLSPPATASFVMPLGTNITVLPDSYFRAESAPFYTTNVGVGSSLFNGFEQTGRFPLPQFNLTVSNRIRFIMLDRASGRVLDYVNIGGLNGVRDLSAELIEIGAATPLSPSETIFWQTNRPGSGTLYDPPGGVINQIQAALGVIDVPDWNIYGVGQASGSTKNKEIELFRAFIGLSSTEENTNLVQLVPFAPTRKISQYRTWQANDPVVHHSRQQLGAEYLFGNGISREAPNGPMLVRAGERGLNNRFEPWGGSPVAPGYGGPPSAAPPFLTAVKDAGVRSSDDWSAIANGPLSIAWLGKVHRGTPWQTLYLKSEDVAPSTWSYWIGGWDTDSASRGRPVNDRALISALAVLLNTNSPASLFSINSTDTNTWKQVLDGLVVYTNTSSDVMLTSTPPAVTFGTNVMTSALPQASVIATGILQTRGGATWSSVGDVLRTSEFSEASPWLNTNSNAQLQLGISDEAYEAIAAQLLPRLRQDSVGAMVKDQRPPTIEFSGYDGFPYVVERSADLVNWFPASTNYPANGKWRFMDVGGFRAGQRFYRSRLLP